MASSLTDRDVAHPAVALSRLGLFAILFAATFTIMVGCAIAPSLPAIAVSLHLGRHAGWLVTLPALGVVLSGPLISWLLAGRFTMRTVMMHGLFFYGLIGVSGVAVAHHPALLYADRLLLGLPTAAMMASGGALISHFFHGPARLKVLSWQGMSVEGGGIVFLAAGGLLGAVGWQYPFALYLCAWVCLVLLIQGVPEFTHGSSTREKLPSRGGKPVGLVMLVAGISMTLFFVSVLALPQVLLERFQLASRASGFILAYISLVTVICISQLPRLVRRNRSRHLLGIALLLFALAHLLLAIRSNLPLLLLGSTIMGAAFALSIPLTVYLITEMSAADRRGPNLAFHSSSVFLGQCVASCVMTFASNGQQAMIWSASLAALAGALVWIRETIVKVTAVEIISW